MYSSSYIKDVISSCSFGRGFFLIELVRDVTEEDIFSDIYEQCELIREKNYAK